MAKWKTPASSDLVLSACGKTAYRKTFQGYKNVIGTPVFREGVHVFGIKFNVKEGAKHGPCIECGLVDEANFSEEWKPENNALRLDKKRLQEELNIFEESEDISKGYHVELKVDMGFRTLAIRKNGASVWVAVPRTYGCVPVAASPWASLGSNLVEVSLLQGFSTVTVDELRADLVQDLRVLFNSNIMSDVTVLIGDVRIPAHSAILAARSKFFAAMLQAPMKEKATREIVLEDVDPVVVRWVLQFLYTCDLDFAGVEKQNGLLATLQAANQFQVPLLEKVCAEAMAASINVDNVSDLLLEADSMSCAHLRKACLAFVADNAAAVQTTDGFKQLPVKRPTILLDVLAAIVPPGKKCKRM